jgi:hypothetical protein
MDFNFFDVKYNTEELTGQKLNSLNISAGGHRKFTDFYTARYPIDLGNVDKNHFVFFTIYQQVRSSAQTRTPTTGRGGNVNDAMRTTFAKKDVSISATGVARGSELVQSALNNGTSIIKNNAAFQALAKKYPGISNVVNEGVKSFNNTTKIMPVTDGNLFNQVEQIQDAIALYMPDTLAFSSSQSYSDVSMSDIGLGLVGASALSELMKSNMDIGKISKIVGANISPFAYAGIKKSLGTSGTSLFTAFTGQVMNPQLELLYSSPSFREFNLDFMFYPRSEQEAQEVYKIIELFNYHSAPEVKTGEAGFFMYPPSMFDIQFMYGSSENVNLPKMSSCVLTRVDIDYAPNGFAAYETYSSFKNVDDKSRLGGTGTPVATRMTLHFKETQIQSKHTILYNNANRGQPFKSEQYNPFTSTPPPAETKSDAVLGGGDNPIFDSRVIPPK